MCEARIDPDSVRICTFFAEEIAGKYSENRCRLIVLLYPSLSCCACAEGFKFKVVKSKSKFVSTF